MECGRPSKLGIQNFRDEKYQVLSDEPKAAAIRCPILDVEVSERFLARDGEISETEHFLKSGKLDRRIVVNMMHINLKHLGKEGRQLAIHVIVTIFEKAR